MHSSVILALLETFKRRTLSLEDFLAFLRLRALLSMDLVSSFIRIIDQSINTYKETSFPSILEHLL